MRLKIKVFPKSSRECIVEKNGLIKVYVKAAPDKGKANKAVMDLIAKSYNVKKKDVTIVTGMTSQHKTVEVFTE